jgi:DNA-binding CsgD family transcriptional regulator
MSFTPLRLDPSRPPDIGFRPAILEPMLRAAEVGEDLVPALKGIVGDMGFSSFMYGLSTAIRPGRDSLVYFIATQPREWSLHYEAMNYIEIDPRIETAAANSGPTPWDWESALARCPPRRRAQVQAFLHDAARYGIGSGIAWGIRNRDNHGVIVCLNAPERSFGASQRARLARTIGDVLAFGTYFHEFFVRNFVERDMPSRLRGAALTEREVTILQYVARGLTAEDIGDKLDIAPRTVRFHIDSARTKVGALNREEAIALLAKAGLIDIPP